MRRELMEAILSFDMNYTYIDGLLAWNTQRIGQIEVEHRPRAEGHSGYSLRKLILLSLNLLTNFSLLPLQFVSILGIGFALAGFVGGMYYLLQYLLSNIGVPGFATIVITVLILGGAQMMALGVIGEYIGRVHLNVNRKPQYTERQVLIRKKTTAFLRR